MEYLFAGVGVLSNLTFIRETVLFTFRYFGIRYYTITSDRDFMRKVIRRISKDCVATTQRVYSDMEYPSGFYIGANAIGSIDTDSPWLDNWTIRMLCKESYYKSIQEEARDISLEKLNIQTETQVKENITQSITLLCRRGTFEDMRYGSIKIDVADLHPLGNQRSAMDEIIESFTKKRNSKVFIHGNPGTGKSALAILLAKELNGIYCHTFDPTTPGDHWESFYGTYKDHVGSGPLIVVIEEANKLIDDIHYQRIEQHIKMPTVVKNKSTWCNFMDDLIFYKNVIFILTSNQSKEDIDKLDPAYLRPGRMDVIIEMKDVIVD